MWTGDAAAAWRLYLLNWIVLGLTGAAFALSLSLTDFTLAFAPARIGFGFVLVYAAFSFFNALAPNRRDPQVVFVIGGMAQIVLITLLMAPFTYIAAAVDLPMQDHALMAIDRALGFDWLGYVKYVNDRPLLAIWIDFGYRMIKWPLLIIPVVLAAVHQYRRLQEYTLAFLLALIVTTAISAMVPAIGVFQEVGLPVTSFPNLNPGAYLSQLHDLPLVRAGTLRVLDLGALAGVVTFPSFHAASAALYTWALWPSKWFRLIAIIANVAMLAATPINGGHYFIDLIGGIAVAVLAIVAARRTGRRVSADLGETAPVADKPLMGGAGVLTAG
jgi:PAP2 superfamily